MQQHKSILDIILLGTCSISIAAIGLCALLLISDKDNTNDTVVNTYDLYAQFKTEEQDKENSLIIVEKVLDNQFLNQNDSKIEIILEESSSTTYKDVKHEPRTEISDEYFNAFGDITSVIKDELQRNNQILIEKIDKVYQLDQTIDIINDIIPWNDYVEDVNMESELLYIDHFVSATGVACTPFKYGYSEQLAKTLFKDRIFPDCGRTDMIFSFDKNYVRVNCREEPEYIIGGLGNDQELGERKVSYPWNPVINDMIPLNGHEFVIIRCRRTIKQALRINQFSQAASDRSKAITEKIQNIVNSPNKKPVGIYVLMLDSVSRRHFFRNLPITIDYLNTKISKSNSKFVMYDFLINNVYDFHTTGNLVPMLFGSIFEHHWKNITDNLNKDDLQYNDVYKYLQESLMLKHYERLGFVTAFDWDTVKNNFNLHAGKKIYADSTPLNFWSAAQQIYNYDDFLPRRNCFGDKNHQKYVLDYINSFNKNYKEHNRFGYFHISVGHEWSGLYIKTLDKDMKSFLEEFFEYYEHNDEDFVLMIAGDHGRGIQEWDLNIEGFMENELPLHMVITSKRLISRFGNNTHQIMQHNTNRLISRSDWYVTLKHLAITPYGNFDINSETYKRFKSNSISDKSISVFLEKIPDNRVCEDVKIRKAFCTCRTFEPVTSEVLKTAVVHIINQKR